MTITYLCRLGGALVLLQHDVTVVGTQISFFHWTCPSWFKKKERKSKQTICTQVDEIEPSDPVHIKYITIRVTSSEATSSFCRHQMANRLRRRGIKTTEREEEENPKEDGRIRTGFWRKKNGLIWRASSSNLSSFAYPDYGRETIILWQFPSAHRFFLFLHLVVFCAGRRNTNSDTNKWWFLSSGV